LIRFVRHPLRPLQRLDRQLQPRRLADVAGNQRAVHTQFARLHAERGDLLVGDLQVLAGRLHVLRDAQASVVRRAQVEMPLAHVAGARRIAHLDIETKAVAGFFVAPANVGFERLESDQNVDWGGGARVLLRVENGERLRVDAAEEPVGEGARPELFQTLLLLLGQRINAAEQGPLEVHIVIAKHPDLLNHAMPGAPFFQGSQYFEDCHLREPLLFYNTGHGDVENSAPALCFDDDACCMDSRPMDGVGLRARTRHDPMNERDA
jgi:hypothetical protein